MGLWKESSSPLQHRVCYILLLDLCLFSFSHLLKKWAWPQVWLWNCCFVKISICSFYCLSSHIWLGLGCPNTFLLLSTLWSQELFGQVNCFTSHCLMCPQKNCPCLDSEPLLLERMWNIQQEKMYFILNLLSKWILKMNTR